MNKLNETHLPAIIQCLPIGWAIELNENEWAITAPFKRSQREMIGVGPTIYDAVELANKRMGDKSPWVCIDMVDEYSAKAVLSSDDGGSAMLDMLRSAEAVCKFLVDNNHGLLCESGDKADEFSRLIDQWQKAGGDS